MVVPADPALAPQPFQLDDELAAEEPKTRQAVDLLDRLDVTGKAVQVDVSPAANLSLAVRNLAGVQMTSILYCPSASLYPSTTSQYCSPGMSPCSPGARRTVGQVGGPWQTGI